MIFKDNTGKIPVVYSESYYVDIGDHVFPTSKYRLIKKRIDSDESVRERIRMLPPEAASEEDVLSVHTAEYIEKLRNGSLSPEEVLTMEVPYSPALVEASLACCGGTLTAARAALESKAALHLGGGFHHAFADHGEGFCLLNDVAVSIKGLQKRGAVDKALVIDCDLHQGNGTASIFSWDDSVFTFSMHQENNYPYHKPQGDMDIGLPDYTRDKIYLRHLSDNVPQIISSFKPGIIIFLAGADPYEQDQLGGLRLTKKGLRDRDNYVCEQARNFGVPIAIVLAGGYAANREDTVDIHFGTLEECVKVFTYK